MKNYEIRGKSAFYDSVANQTPLFNAAQSKKWLDGIKKEHEVETLYIRTVKNSYYKQSNNGEIKAISLNDFQSEWENCRQSNVMQNNDVKSDNTVDYEQGMTEREKLKRMINDEIESIVAKIRLKIEK